MLLIILMIEFCLNINSKLWYPQFVHEEKLLFLKFLRNYYIYCFNKITISKYEKNFGGDAPIFILIISKFLQPKLRLLRRRTFYLQ